MNPYLNDIKLLKLCKDNNDPKCNCINKKTNSLSEARLFKSFECYAPECYDTDNYITELIKNKQKRCNVTSCETSINKINLDKDSSIKIKNNCTMTTIKNDKFDLENIYRAQSYDIIPQNNIFNYIFYFSIIIIYGIFINL